jgi:hypothetical protein
MPFSIARLFGDGICPLCDGRGTYRVWDEIEPSELALQLSKDPAWKKAHGVANVFSLETGAPMPGLSRKPKSDPPPPHHRCAYCNSLLPPSFHERSSHTFSLTVTGYPESGKSTWLKEAFQHSRFGVFAATGEVNVETYPYAEPFQVEGANARTNIPFLLSGREVELVLNGKSRTVLVRILDVMGERFYDQGQPAVPRHTRDVLSRHLRQGGRGALLVLDRLRGATSSQLAPEAAGRVGSIGKAFGDVYQAVAGELNRRNRVDTSLWSGVVWTRLDEAVWSDEAAAWIANAMPTVDASPLLALAAQPLPRAEEDRGQWLALVANLEPALVWRLASAVWRQTFRQEDRYETYRSDAIDEGCPEDCRFLPWSDVAFVPLDRTVLEALIALLFRLQVAYGYLVPEASSLTAFSFEPEGYAFIDGTRYLARALYVLWDRARNGVVCDMVANNTIQEVLPVGFVGREPGAREGGLPVWGDLILRQAIHGSRVLL